MTDQMNPSVGDVTSDDKLWAMLCYVLPVIGPILVLIMQGKKDRPFIKAQIAQSLILGVLIWVLGAACIGVLLWFYALYLGFAKAYAGQPVVIPVLTDLCKNQGWA